ncbi:MAG: Ig-like domain-containing protein [Verrucomicrobiota bacterium]
MKTQLHKFKPLAWTGVVAWVLAPLFQGAFADSITVSETWKDNTLHGVYFSSSDTGTFNGSLTIPGLSAFTANDWSNLLVTINAPNLSTGENSAGVVTNFSDFMADAPNYGGSITATSATFVFQLDDTNQVLRNAFQMNFSRSGNTLTISGKTLNPPALGGGPWSIVAWNYFDPESLGETFVITNDPISCEVTLQNSTTLQQYADIVKTIYVDGINVITYDSESNELFNIRVTGAADYTPPILTAESPTSALTTTNSLLTAKVKATDNIGVANVEFFLNGSDYGSGVIGPSSLWFLSFALPPGTNVLRTLATDVSGNNSPTNSISVIYVNKQTNANAITFSDHWLDSSQTDYYGDLFDVSQDNGTLNAALLVPELKSMSASTWSNLLLTITFGDINYTNSLSQAHVLTASTAIFDVHDTYDSDSNLVTDVQMSLTRLGGTLVLAYETANPTYDYNNPIIADFYFGWDSPVQDVEPFAFTLQDGNTLNFYSSVARPVYISGFDSTNFDSSTNELDDIQVSGAADFVPPTDQITTPLPNQLWSNALVTVTGKARDNVQVAGVYCSADGVAWIAATSSNNWTNWVAQVPLTPGTNTIAAYAVDASGNDSPTNTVRIVYVLSAVLAVSTNGAGAITPKDNGALLPIGRNYTLTATALAGSGFSFTNWTGGTSLPLSVLTNKPALQFQMESNLMLQANFVDTAKPVLRITNVAAGLQVSNANFVVSGTATDNVAVASVYCQLNGTGWVGPATFAGRNWSDRVTLNPGTNHFQAYAVDTSGNVSPTDTVSIVYVLSAVLAVSTNGAGSIAPKDNGALLQIGRNYTLTATALTGSGFAFTNWTGGTSLPLSVLTNKPALQFQMVSNLVLQANFVDTAKPVLRITNVVAGLLVSNANFVVSGTATDNVAVAGVYCQLNRTGWAIATNFAGRDWRDRVTLNPGTNQFQAYAVDTSGNVSPTDTVSIVYVLSAVLAVSTNGAGSITPKDNGALLEIGRNYTLVATALPGSGFVFTNWTGGTSLPLGVLTNKPALQFQMVSNLILQANFVDAAHAKLAGSQVVPDQPLEFAGANGGLMVANGSLQIRLRGPAQATVIIESSPDLVHWQPVQTNALPADGITVSLPLDQQPAKFIRARLQP